MKSKALEYTLKYRNKHDDEGLCRQCPNVAVGGMTLCQVCRDKRITFNARNNKKWKAKYRLEGRCSSCSAPLEEGEITCFNCKDKKLRSMKGRKPCNE